MRKAKMQSLAERIKLLRRERGLTQCQVAEFVGVTQATVSTWEVGSREVPKADNLIRLAEVFGVDPVQLIDAIPRSSAGPSAEQKLLAAFRALPRENQLEAIRLVEALKLTGN